MKKNLYKLPVLLLAISAWSCGQNQQEDKTLASTHPKLENQLAKDSVDLPTEDPENADTYQRYRITEEEYRNSGNYAVPNLYRGKLAALDENSDKDARAFRTALNEGMKQGVNFAGKYTVVTVGCGTSCQVHYVVDRENGKVLDKVQSSMGARYSADSRLFIINPTDSTVNYNECRNCTPEAYVFENGKFRKLEAKNQPAK